MKIDKAIEILEFNALEPDSYLPPDCIDALKLGIEALKRTLGYRKRGMTMECFLLPGETEGDSDDRS